MNATQGRKPVFGRVCVLFCLAAACLCCLTAGATAQNGPWTISFSIWALFDMQPGGVYHDLDARMREMRDRGFNCVRFDDGAGFFRTPEGAPRGPVKIRPPFGKFTADMRQNVVISPRLFDAAKNLVTFVKAADRHGISVILSSWYYLHTNWFCDEAFNRPLNEGMTTERKFAYFTDELDCALELLAKNGLTHRIAYAELFNEVDGLPFTGRYGKLPKDRALHIRALHERALARLKERHPDVRFACDFANCSPQVEVVPRNAEILAAHPYYAWGIYGVFDRGAIRPAKEEFEIPATCRRYLLSQPYALADVIAEMGGCVRTGLEWPSRVRTYTSLDTCKIPQLEQELIRAFETQRVAFVTKKLPSLLDATRKVRDAVLPGRPIVMAEGVTYCGSNRLLFEEHCDGYWEMLRTQAKILREAGWSGAVPRTMSGPEDPAWMMRSKELADVNRIFLQGN